MCSRNKENKEKETSVKTSIFLGVCGSGEMTDDKELAWLSATTAPRLAATQSQPEDDARQQH